jgi:multidrug resistance efflux pump
VNLLKAWQREFAAWIANNQTLDVYRSSRLTMCSDPGESERDFRTRIAQLLREERDRAVDELRSKYASKIAVLQERLRKAEATEQKQQEQASQAKLSSVLEIGGSLLGAFLGGGRKTSLSKITSASRAAGRVYTESKDVSRAKETAAAINQQLADLQAELEAEVASLQAVHDPAQQELETVTIRPKKTGVVVKSILVSV